MVHSPAPATLELGDRFEVFPVDSTERLKLPRVLGPDGFPIERIEDPTGRLLEVELDPAEHSAVVPGLGRGVTNPASTFWLEYQGSGRFRLIVRTGSGPAGQRRADNRAGSADRVRLTRQVCRPVRVELFGWTAGLRTGPGSRPAGDARGFDRLIALPLVRDIELLEHQIRTAKTVLRRFRGRAMLCDEVGLGKTIEAGLVLSELMIRGLVRSVLVLVPPSLIEQWQGEMRRKFAIELISHDDPSFRERGTDGLDGVRPRDRLDPHGQARAAPVGDPGPQVGHGDRRRGAPPAQPQHPGLEVRQRGPEAVHPAADGDPGAEQPRGAVQPGHPAGAGPAEHVAAVPAAISSTPRQADAAQRGRAARPAGRGDDPQSAEHGRPAVHSAVGEDRADCPVAARAGPLPAT